MPYDYELLARKRDDYSYSVSDNGRIFGYVGLTDVTGASLWVFVPTEPFRHELRVEASESLHDVLADLREAYTAMHARARKDWLMENGHAYF